jgi:hypothetical protein
MVCWAGERQPQSSTVGSSSSIKREEQEMKARIITVFFTVMALAAALAPVANAAAIGRW